MLWRLNWRCSIFLAFIGLTGRGKEGTYCMHYGMGSSHSPTVGLDFSFCLPYILYLSTYIRPFFFGMPFSGGWLSVVSSLGLLFFVKACGL